MCISEWSSDVCSSDLLLFLAFQRQQQPPLRRGHRQHRQARALAGQGEVFTQRVCIVADRLQRDRGVELAHETDVDKEPARLFLRRLGRSEEHTSELQSLMRISYAVFCLKKKKKQ